MSDEHEVAPLAATKLRAESVQYVDASNVRWRVTERASRGDPGSRGDFSLIFECDDAVRRVWEYPVGWRTLSSEALVALSWRK